MSSGIYQRYIQIHSFQLRETEDERPTIKTLSPPFAEGEAPRVCGSEAYLKNSLNVVYFELGLFTKIFSCDGCRYLLNGPGFFYIHLEKRIQAIFLENRKKYPVSRYITILGRKILYST